MKITISRNKREGYYAGKVRCNATKKYGRIGRHYRTGGMK